MEKRVTRMAFQFDVDKTGAMDWGVVVLAAPYALGSDEDGLSLEYRIKSDLDLIRSKYPKEMTKAQSRSYARLILMKAMDQLGVSTAMIFSSGLLTGIAVAVVVAVIARVL